MTVRMSPRWPLWWASMERQRYTVVPILKSIGCRVAFIQWGSIVCLIRQNSKWHTPASAKINSVRAEWHCQSRRGPSQPSETSQWRNNLCPALIPRIALHIALPSKLHHCISHYRSPILNQPTCIVANSDHKSECGDWARGCIGIAMRCVTLPKPLLAFLLSVRKIQSSLY
jgi:hypothetical protein